MVGAFGDCSPQFLSPRGLVVGASAVDTVEQVVKERHQLRRVGQRRAHRRPVRVVRWEKLCIIS